MTMHERGEAMTALSHANMQLGAVVELVSKLFRHVPDDVARDLYPQWAEAYKAALHDMQNAYTLGVTEEKTKCVAMMAKLKQTNL